MKVASTHEKQETKLQRDENEDLAGDSVGKKTWNLPQHCGGKYRIWPPAAHCCEHSYLLPRFVANSRDNECYMQCKFDY